MKVASTTDSTPVRIGLVGCGLVMELKHMVVLARICKQGAAEVTAVADTDQSACSRVADIHGVAGRFTDIDALLSAADVDAIAVCTPPDRHAEVACRALQAGKHVLVEKPLAVGLDDCDRMVDAAARTGALAMVGHHMRWHRQVLRAREMIASGTLGQVESIRSTWTTPVRLERDLPAWRNHREQGGGGIIEIGVHHFDLWRYLLGTEVERVFATTRSQRWLDQGSVITARMSDGVPATAVITEASTHDIEVEIHGTAGRLRMSCLRFDGFDFASARSVPGGAAMPVRRLTKLVRALPRGLAGMARGGDYMGSYEAEWRHFIECIRTGGAVDCTLADGRRAVEAVLAAVESASTGHAVAVAEAPASVRTRQAQISVRSAEAESAPDAADLPDAQDAPDAPATSRAG